MMKLSWRDILAALLALFGAVVVFAKLRAYSWWLIGSWKGALGVLAVTGLAIMATYFVDWLKDEGSGIVGETFLWMVSAVVVIGSLFATTNKVEFVWSAVSIGVAWLGQLGAHTWSTTHDDHTSRLAHVH